MPKARERIGGEDDQHGDHGKPDHDPGAPVVKVDLFDQENGIEFTVLYRDKSRIAYAKKIHIKRFIRDREYELIKGKLGKVDHLIRGHVDYTVHLYFVPAKRQRITETTFELSSINPIGVTARGSRMAPKTVSKLKLIKHAGDFETANEDAESPDTGGATATRKRRKPPKKPGGNTDDGEQFSLF